MKKVLIIATVGGFLQKFEMGNVRILQEMGYEVHYAANPEMSIYRFDQTKLSGAGVKIHPMDIRKSPLAVLHHRKAVQNLTDLIRREKIDLIHCHTPVGGYLGRQAGKKCGRPGIKVIYTSHGFHFYKGAPPVRSAVFRMIERKLAAGTDIIITVNNEDFKSACGFRLKPGGAVYRIPGVGLDTESFCPPGTQERSTCRKRLGIPEDAFFLLSVGELNRNKNHRIMIRAIHKLKAAENGGLKIFYGICGDGPGRRALEKEIRKLDLERQVVLYGYCDPVRDYLAGADAFAFPSRREGLGMAALEALSMGIPVLAAANRGTREYIDPGKNGYLFSWRDAAAFAGGIRRLAERSEAERHSMEVCCRRSVRPFQKERTEEMMRKIYESLDSA